MTPPDTHVTVASEPREMPAEWERWRGSIDTSLQALPDLLTTHLELAREVQGKQLRQIERNIHENLSDFKERLVRIETQTRITNGRVTALEAGGAATEKAEEKAEREHDREEEAQDRLEVREERARGKRLYTLRQVIGAIAAVTAGLGGLATFLLAFHLI